MRERHEGDKTCLDAFAQCMVETLSGCRAKLRSVRSGAKTCDAVVKVCAAWSTAAAASSQTPEASEAESVESTEEDEQVVEVGGEPDEVDAANQALLKTMALFGGEAPTSRTLAKKDSIVSVGSSAPTSPKTASVDAKLDIKADHPLHDPRGSHV